MGRHSSGPPSSGMGKAVAVLLVILLVIGVASWFILSAVAP